MASWWLLLLLSGVCACVWCAGAPSRPTQATPASTTRTCACHGSPLPTSVPHTHTYTLTHTHRRYPTFADKVQALFVSHMSLLDERRVGMACRLHLLASNSLDLQVTFTASIAPVEGAHASECQSKGASKSVCRLMSRWWRCSVCVAWYVAGPLEHVQHGPCLEQRGGCEQERRCRRRHRRGMRRTVAMAAVLSGTVHGWSVDCAWCRACACGNRRLANAVV
jgi:hypothetical protein